MADHFSRDSPEAAIRGGNFVNAVIQFRKRVPMIDMGIEICIWSVHPNAKISDVPHCFRQHQADFLRPNIRLYVNKNVSIKAIEGSVPLFGEICVVTNVLPMRVTESNTVVGVDYCGFTMRPEQFF